MDWYHSCLGGGDETLACSSISHRSSLYRLNAHSHCLTIPCRSGVCGASYRLILRAFTLCPLVRFSHKHARPRRAQLQPFDGLAFYVFARGHGLRPLEYFQPVNQSAWAHVILAWQLYKALNALQHSPMRNWVVRSLSGTTLYVNFFEWTPVILTKKNSRRCFQENKYVERWGTLALFQATKWLRRCGRESFRSRSSMSTRCTTTPPASTTWYPIATAQ